MSETREAVSNDMDLSFLRPFLRKWEGRRRMSNCKVIAIANQKGGVGYGK